MRGAVASRGGIVIWQHQQLLHGHDDPFERDGRRLLTGQIIGQRR